MGVARGVGGGHDGTERAVSGRDATRRARAHPIARRAPRFGGLLAGALALVVGTAWPGPACACGGPATYDLYAPFRELTELVDHDGGADWGGGAHWGPHAFEFSFLGPVLLAEGAPITDDEARADSLGAALVASANDAASRARAERRADLARLWARRGRWPDRAAGDEGPARLDDSALAAALRAGALDAAEREARALVRRAIEMPAAQAQVEQRVVRRAVELVELRPAIAASGGRPDGAALARYFAAATDAASATAAAGSLPPVVRASSTLRARSRAELAALADEAAGATAAGAAVEARRPSLRFVALQERARAITPEGWPGDSAWDAAAGPFRALRREQDAWLAAHPAHPLADLVRFERVRAHRFAGDTARAWAALLAEYPRHPVRALAEMRHLLAVDVRPPAALLARVDDPVLRSAFVLERMGCASYCASGIGRYPHAPWNAEWRRAEAARPAAWAVNLQERLLRVALADSTSRAPLPEAFPTRAEAPTPLWGVLRAALLVRAERWPEAEAQAAVLPEGPVTAALGARLALRRTRWTEAITRPGLSEDAMRYWMRVLAPDSVVARVAASASGAARAEAARTRAGRLAAAGDWAGAAREAAAVDTALARRLARTAALADDRTAAGRLALARHLVAQQDSLLLGADERAWYRALDGRLDQLADPRSPAAPVIRSPVPWTAADERAAIARHLRTQSELYLALRTYAEALPALPPAAARAAAREADVPYNALRNRNYESTGFWRAALARDPAVAALRRAGRGGR